MAGYKKVNYKEMACLLLMMYNFYIVLELEMKQCCHFLMSSKLTFHLPYAL